MASLIGFEQSLEHGLLPFLSGALVKSGIEIALGSMGASAVENRVKAEP